MSRPLSAAALVTLFWFGLVMLVWGVPRTQPHAPVLSYVSQVDSNNWHIYLTDIRRGVHVNLTRALFAGSARNRLPTWSPDGETLAFVSDGGGDNHVHLYDMRTHQHRRLTNGSVIYSSLSWSPDGTQLAVSATAATPAGVRLIDVATGDVRQITRENATAHYAGFAPSGDRVLYLETDRDYPRIVISDLTSTADHCLAPCTAFTGQLTAPQWSPDGQYITYASVAIPGSPKTLGISHAHTDNAALVTSIQSDSYAWSPDGEQIAFTVGTTLRVISNVKAAFGEHFAPDVTTLVTTDPTGHIVGVAWSPDGSHIALTMDNARHPLPEIFVVNVATGRLRQVTANTRNDWSPAWKP